MTTSPAAGGVRLLRTLTLAGASVGLAATAHAGAGGGVPGGPILLLVALPVLMSAALLTARRCQLPLVVAVLGVEQLVCHLAFGASMAISPGCAPMEGMHAAGCIVPPASTPAADGRAASVSMLLAHVVATLLVAVLLVRGEALLWRVAERVTRAWALLSRRPDDAVARLGWDGLAVAAVGVGVATDAGPRGPPR